MNISTNSNPNKDDIDDPNVEEQGLDDNSQQPQDGSRSEIDDDLEQSIEDNYLDFDTPQQVSSLSIWSLQYYYVKSILYVNRNPGLMKLKKARTQGKHLELYQPSCEHPRKNKSHHYHVPLNSLRTFNSQCSRVFKTRISQEKLGQSSSRPLLVLFFITNPIPLETSMTM